VHVIVVLVFILLLIFILLPLPLLLAVLVISIIIIIIIIVLVAVLGSIESIPTPSPRRRVGGKALRRVAYGTAEGGEKEREGERRG
jgi:hypothetical protein